MQTRWTLRARLGVLLTLVVVGGAVFAVWFALSDGDLAGGVSLRPSSRTEADALETPAEGDEVLSSLEELVGQYGEPPDATLARMRIPKVNVDAGVAPRYVDGTHMPEPDGPAEIVHYDMSQWPGMGGMPGEGGNAIFAAHIDLNRHIPYAGVHYRGPGVFYDLSNLAPGDVIEIDYNGQTLRYAVTWQQQLDANGAEWTPIWSNDVAVDSITLFTCGGEFDPNTHSYSHRTVIRAERIA